MWLIIIITRQAVSESAEQVILLMSSNLNVSPQFELHV